MFYAKLSYVSFKGDNKLILWKKLTLFKLGLPKIYSV
jgi:hypothetical protein